MKKENLSLYTARGAIIAALYVVLTMLASVMGLSSGMFQFRFSEALCILPIFLPEALPGLFIGCLISNLLAGGVIWDIIFGSIATLIGAIGARLLRNLPERVKWVATLPTLLANMIIVPYVLIYAYGVPDSYFFLMFTVGVGEAVCACIGGSGLYYLMKKTEKQWLK
nr:QueT transporter family protein [Oscillospiraceae bacterium]